MMLKITLMDTLLMVIFILSIMDKACSADNNVTLQWKNPPSARAAALGEALCAGKNDVMNAFYNPATLATLKENQIGFEHHSGILGDKSNNGAMGIKRDKNRFGLFLNHHSSGLIQVMKENEQFDVEAQKSLGAGLTWAHQEEFLSVGITSKFLKTQTYRSSDLSIYAVDIGIIGECFQNNLLGISFRNIGPSLSIAGETFRLPTQLVGGMSHLINLSNFNATTFISEIYQPNGKSYASLLGIETILGPIALRVGAQFQNNQKSTLSMGTGIQLKSISIDYSLSFRNSQDPEQKISFLYRFINSDQKIQLAPIHFEPKISGNGEKKYRTIYEVNSTDTWQSIAKKFYGDENSYQKIIFANRHLLSSDGKFTIGQKVVIP